METVPVARKGHSFTMPPSATTGNYTQKQRVVSISVDSHTNTVVVFYRCISKLGVKQQAVKGPTFCSYFNEIEKLNHLPPFLIFAKLLGAR